jgi:hypothetical protein
MKIPVKDLVLVFIANVIGATVWFIVGGYFYSDLHVIDLSLSITGWGNLLTHYALPIGIFVTFFFYIELFLYKRLMAYRYQ